MFFGDPRGQQGFTAIAAVRKGQEQALAALLDTVGSDVRRNGVVDFSALRRTHFLRWVLVEPLRDRRGAALGPTQLVLATNYDPPRHLHLRELVRAAGDGFHRIYRHCEGYPEGSDTTVGAAIAYLEARSVRAHGYYIGHARRTAKQITDEADLRGALQLECDAVDRARGWNGHGPGDVREHLRRKVDAKPLSARVAHAPLPELRTLARLVAALVLWLPILLVAIVVLGPFLLVKEWRDARTDDPDGREALAEAEAGVEMTAALRDEHEDEGALPGEFDQLDALRAREDYVVQNQLTHLSEIKPGLTRQLTLRITLRVIDTLARYFYHRGHLNGIPTIHFARWIIIDGGKRLLFFSNYDGSWESYLGDFIDQAAKGLTAIWSNTRGFPATRFLVGRGARDEERFKTWTRAKQRPTQVWYSAYPNLSVRNVNHNTALRRGLVEPCEGTDLERWADLL